MSSMAYSRLTTFRQTLAAERMRIVLHAAGGGSVPPMGFLTHLASLDGAIAAVEAVIEETETSSREGSRAEPRQSVLALSS